MKQKHKNNPKKESKSNPFCNLICDECKTRPAVACFSCKLFCLECIKETKGNSYGIKQLTRGATIIKGGGSVWNFVINYIGC